MRTHDYSERAEECHAIAANQRTLDGRNQWERVAKMYEYLAKKEHELEQRGQHRVFVPGGRR